MLSLEEALFIRKPKAEEQSLQDISKKDISSQNITFQERELQDIEQIKPLLQQKYTQEQIAKELKCARETVNRKIAKWSQTEDYKQWLHTIWLTQYNELATDQNTKIESFKQLTRYISALATRKLDVKSEVTEKITATVDVNHTVNLLNQYETIILKETTT